MAAVFTKFVELILFTLAGLFQGLRQDWNIFELVALGGIWVALNRGWRPRVSIVERLEAIGSRLAEHRNACCLAAGIAAITVRAALIPVLPAPKPVASDEFSHLLLADTLLQGRVANPTHPLWVHFEGLQIIQQPHYVSNYFPGQAMVLAAARWITGSPWVGILLLSGIFCAVICWMLQGWVASEWALIGAVLAILRFAIGSYWINAYHGGFLPAIGGALIAGAYPRLRDKASASMSIVFGFGLAILACTRPFEGFLFSAPLLAALMWAQRKRAWMPRVRTVAPAMLIAALAVVGLGLYFRAITGSPVVTAYQVSQKMYGWPMSVAWAKPVEVPHRNQELHWYWEYERDEHGKIDTPLHFIEYLTFRLQEYWRFFLGPGLTLALIALWRGVGRASRPVTTAREASPTWVPVLLALGGAFTAVLLEGAASPHYLAPATGVIVLAVVLGFEKLRRTEHGVVLTRVLPLLMIATLTLRIAAQDLGLPYTQKLNYQSWCCKVQGNYSKAALTEYLLRQPGRHLVIVRQKTDPYNLFQWIYNDADIDHSRIVWARDMGGENRRLLEYFADRDVWVVDPNAEPPTMARGPMPDRFRRAASCASAFCAPTSAQ